MKTSHESNTYLRQNVSLPKDDAEIRRQMMVDFGLSEISSTFWKWSKDARKDYLDAVEDEGLSAWKSLLDELDQMAKYEMLRLKDKESSGFSASGAEDDCSAPGMGAEPTSEPTLENREAKDQTISSNERRQLMECLSLSEQVRFVALQLYFSARAEEIAKAWREKYLDNRCIITDRHTFLNSPALRLFSFAQLKTWGIDSLSASSTIVFKEKISEQKIRVVIEFSPSAIRREIVYEPSKLTACQNPYEGYVEGEQGFLANTGLAGSAFDDILRTANQLAKNFRLKQNQALILLLNGQKISWSQEALKIERGAVQCWPKGRSIARRVPSALTLTLPDFLSAETVARLYRVAQRKTAKSLATKCNKEKGLEPQSSPAALDIRNSLLFMFMVDNQLTDNRLAELPASSRRVFADRWNCHVEQSRIFFSCMRSTVSAYDDAVAAGRGDKIGFFTAVQHKDCLPSGLIITSVWGRAVMEAWGQQNEKWQFKDKDNKPDTRRFVEECKRAESHILHISKTCVGDTQLPIPYLGGIQPSGSWFELELYDDPRFSDARL